MKQRGAVNPGTFVKHRGPALWVKHWGCYPWATGNRACHWKIWGNDADISVGITHKQSAKYLRRLVQDGSRPMFCFSGYFGRLPSVNQGQWITHPPFYRRLFSWNLPFSSRISHPTVFDYQSVRSNFHVAGSVCCLPGFTMASEIVVDTPWSMDMTIDHFVRQHVGRFRNQSQTRIAVMTWLVSVSHG